MLAEIMIAHRLELSNLEYGAFNVMRLSVFVAVVNRRSRMSDFVKSDKLHGKNPHTPYGVWGFLLALCVEAV
jgi:hypothetical protein